MINLDYSSKKSFNYSTMMWCNVHIIICHPNKEKKKIYGKNSVGWLGVLVLAWIRQSVSNALKWSRTN